LNEQIAKPTSPIPALADVMLALDARFVASASSEKADSVLVDILSEFITAPDEGADVVDLLLLAHGCHEAAAAFAKNGDDTAGLYHAMGQDLIAKALGILGAAVGSALSQSGVIRH
jgi:hypothetical protein